MVQSNWSCNKDRVYAIVHFASAMHLENTDEDEVVFYIMLRAVDRFCGQYNRHPGAEPNGIEPDIAKLKVSTRHSEPALCCFIPLSVFTLNCQIEVLQCICGFISSCFYWI